MPREPYTRVEGTLYYAADGAAGRALAAADDELGALIAQVGEVRLDIDGDPFVSLARAIVDQQISGAAAATIWRRFEALCGGRVTPDAVLGHTTQDLRGCGLSGQKTGYLQDLAAHVADGRIDFAALAEYEDEDIIETLTAVRGIGRWTAQMFLIFSLGRPDVFAADDGGLRRAVARLRGVDANLPKAAIEAMAEDWAPHRTAAALFLWKALNTTDD
ncbi:MAG: DNA-3-methyladenine glycosylase [Actinomycetes bacterium]|jgi:DNA-3-methyladenine glycosylase II|nr:DNA-3-methyladenine glycosylase [Actinomycetes bacterium]